MTKKEAILIAERFNLLERHINYLEALGLIKFEEEKIIDSPIITIKKYLDYDSSLSVSYPFIVAEEIINALYVAGYKIVKK